MQKPDRTAAYFLSLRVENIRCFGPPQELDLSDGDGKPAQWTILIGDNNTGKTTLLQCLASLSTDTQRDHDADGIPWPTARSPEIKDFIHTFRRYGTHSSTIVADICSGEKLDSDRRGEFERGYELRLDNLGMADGTYVDNDPKLLLVCYGYGASRRMGATSLSLRGKKRGSGSASLFDENHPLTNPEEWFLEADYAAKSTDTESRKRVKRQLEQVKDILVGLLPDVDSIRISKVSDVRESPRVEFKTVGGWMYLDDLGLGYKSMTAWMVDLASRMYRRYETSDDPLSEPTIVLVDEIDLHLHPRWQRDVMEHIGKHFTNTQFVVSAHSPLIVQAAHTANIVLMRREHDHVVIDKNPSAVRGWRVDQILTSDLFGLPSARPPELDDLYKKRKKLLSKPKLRKKEREELELIEQEIAESPAGETEQELEAVRILQQVARHLKGKGEQNS